MIVDFHLIDYHVDIGHYFEFDLEIPLAYNLDFHQSFDFHFVDNLDFQFVDFQYVDNLEFVDSFDFHPVDMILDFYFQLDYLIKRLNKFNIIKRLNIIKNELLDPG